MLEPERLQERILPNLGTDDSHLTNNYNKMCGRYAVGNSNFYFEIPKGVGRKEGVGGFNG